MGTADNALLSRRRWLTLLASAGGVPAAAGLAACGASGGTPPGGATGAARETKPVTLEYWHTWTAHWEEMTKFVGQAFKDRHPHVTVNEAVVTPLMDKLVAAAAGGSPPDVATVYSAINVPSLAEAGVASPMEKFAGKSEVATAKAWYHPMIWDLGTYKGQVYGLAYWEQSACLGWNKALFADVGLDVNRAPRTLSELDEFAVRLTKGAAGQDIERLGFLPVNLWHWVPVYGGQLFDEKAGKITANHPNTVAALEWMAGYRKRFGPDRIDAFMKVLAANPDRAQRGEPFLNNQYGMVEVGGPWKLGDWKKFGPEGFQYGIAPYPNAPGLTGTATYTYGDLSIVPQGAKSPVEGWQFVAFTGGVGGEDDYARVLLWDGGHPINVPVSTKMLGHKALQQALRDYPGFEGMIKLVFEGTRVLIPPKTPAGALYQKRLGDAVSSALKLEKPPKVLLDEVVQDVQQEHDKFVTARK